MRNRQLVHCLFSFISNIPSVSRYPNNNIYMNECWKTLENITSMYYLAQRTWMERASCCVCTCFCVFFPSIFCFARWELATMKLRLQSLFWGLYLRVYFSRIEFLHSACSLACSFTWHISSRARQVLQLDRKKKIIQNNVDSISFGVLEKFFLFESHGMLSYSLIWEDVRHVLTLN